MGKTSRMDPELLPPGVTAARAPVELFLAKEDFKFNAAHFVVHEVSAGWERVRAGFVGVVLGVVSRLADALCVSSRSRIMLQHWASLLLCWGLPPLC